MPLTPEQFAGIPNAPAPAPLASDGTPEQTDALGQIVQTTLAARAKAQALGLDADYLGLSLASLKRLGFGQTQAELMAVPAAPPSPTVSSPDLREVNLPTLPAPTASELGGVEAGDNLLSLVAHAAANPIKWVGELAQGLVKDVVDAAKAIPDFISEGQKVSNQGFELRALVQRLKANPNDTDARNKLYTMRADQDASYKKQTDDLFKIGTGALLFAAPEFKASAVAAGALRGAGAVKAAEFLVEQGAIKSGAGTAIRLIDRAAKGGVIGGAYGYLSSEGDWEAAGQAALTTAALFGVSPIAKPPLVLAGKAVGGAAVAIAKHIKLPEAKAAFMNGPLGKWMDNALADAEDLLRRGGMVSTLTSLGVSREEASMQAAKWDMRVKSLLPRKAPAKVATIAGLIERDTTPTAVIAEYGRQEGIDLIRRAAGLQRHFKEVGSLAKMWGIQTHSAESGDIYNFVLRKHFIPHFFPDPTIFEVGGASRADAVRALIKGGRVKSVPEAEGWLDSWVERAKAAKEGEAFTGYSSAAAVEARIAGMPGYSLDLESVLPIYHAKMARLLNNNLYFGRWRNLPAPALETAPAEAAAAAPAKLVPAKEASITEDLALFREAPPEAVELVVKPPTTVEPPAPRVEVMPQSAIANGRHPLFSPLLSLAGRVEGADARLFADAAISANAKGALEQFIRDTPGASQVGPELRVIFGKDSFLSEGIPFSRRSDIRFFDINTPPPNGIPDPLKSRGGAAPGVEDVYPVAFDALKNSTLGADQKAILGDIMRSYFGAKNTPTHQENLLLKAANLLMPLEVVSKLGLGAITQGSQFLTGVVRTQMRGSLGNLWKTLSKDPEAFHLALQSGALWSYAVREAETQLTGLGGKPAALAQRFLKLVGFTEADMRARMFGMLQGSSMAEYAADDMARLFRIYKKTGKMPAQVAKIEGRLLDLGLDPKDIIAQGGRLTLDQKLLAGNTAAYDVNFWGDALSVPAFTRSPWGRIITQFKSFSYQQSRMIQRHVIDPWVKYGDYGPALRMAMLLPLGGEAIADIKAFIRGRKRDDRVTQRLMENLAQAGGFGLVADVLSQSMKGVSGAYSTLVGPIGTDIASASAAVGQVAKGNLGAAGEWAIRNAPVAIAAGGTKPLLAAGASVAAPAAAELLFPTQEVSSRYRERRERRPAR